jgi:hypothetical protein
MLRIKIIHPQITDPIVKYIDPLDIDELRGVKDCHSYLASDLLTSIVTLIPVYDERHHCSNKTLTRSLVLNNQFLSNCLIQIDELD